MDKLTETFDFSSIRVPKKVKDKIIQLSGKKYRKINQFIQLTLINLVEDEENGVWDESRW